MKIRAMQLKDMEEVVGMMRVFYDSPAVIHAAPDEILIQHGGEKLFYGIWRYMCLGGRSLHERRSERSGDRNCIFQFP